VRTAAQRWTRRLALAQGAFYFLSGVWPLLHLRSFLAVTGPKTDLWLVQTVGALLAVLGGGLVLSARRQSVGAEWHWVGGGAAAVLAAVDLVFVGRHVIPPIYLADAVVEGVLVLAWIGVTWRRLAGEIS
jgi:small basic protein